MSSNERITKRLFLNWLSCPTHAWQDRRQPPIEQTEVERRRIAEGQEIGRRAQSLFADGVLIDDPDFLRAVTKTADLIADSEVPAIFEAAFLSESFAARADILVRRPHGWELCEVKSSTHKDEKVETDHIHDLAYTAMVLRRAGIEIERMTLVRLSKDWRLGMDDSLLFRMSDCTASVDPISREFEAVRQQAARDILDASCPPPVLKKACGKCDYFSVNCLGVGKENTIFDIPRLSEKKFLELTSSGILELSQIPEATSFTDIQSRIVSAARQNAPLVNRGALSKLLDSIAWPAYYLDFETVATAIPFWRGVGPHEQVLTQYSIHVCEAPGIVSYHREYLANASRESRQELTESLLADLGDHGSIVVYSNFEATQLKRLAELFPRFESQVTALLRRIVDLEVAFKEGYYHPRFAGRTSIKVTLPTLIPEMSYDHLEVGNGEMAVAVFASMAKGSLDDESTERARRNLLEYCCQDTLAMVKIHEKLCHL